MPDKVTILILSHDRSWSLAQCVASVREFTRWPYEMVILDNASDVAERSHIARLEGDDCRLRFEDKFWSCLEGRRLGLGLVKTKHVVFLDDDCKVGPLWLTSMMGVMQGRPMCRAVVGNIFQEGTKRQSGARIVSGDEMQMAEYGYQQACDACAGGVTLYQSDTLRETEMRMEFQAGYEDWDQTLQITRDLGGRIYGSRATFFHSHAEKKDGYLVDRWRMTDLMDAAIAIWDRYRIRTAMRMVFTTMHNMRVRPNAEQMRRVLEVMSLGDGV